MLNNISPDLPVRYNVEDNARSRLQKKCFISVVMTIDMVNSSKFYAMLALAIINAFYSANRSTVNSTFTKRKVHQYSV